MVHHYTGHQKKTSFIGGMSGIAHSIGSASPMIANIAGGVGTGLLFAGPEAAPLGISLIGVGGAIEGVNAIMEGKSTNQAFKNINTNLKTGAEGGRLLQKAY